MTYLSHSLIRQTIRILLNEKITVFTHLKPKHHWDLVLKMVFRQNSLYFVSLIMFMDGLYLDNDFWDIISYLLLFLLLLLLFWGCCCPFWFRYFINMIIIVFHYICVLILCGFGSYYFLRLLGIPIIYVCGVCIPFYVIFYALLALRLL